MKQLGLLGLLFLVGCGPYSHQSFDTLPLPRNSKTQKLMDERAVGYTILATKKNKKRFDMTVTLAEQEIVNCKKLLLLYVFYDGFQPRKSNETIKLRFDLIASNGKKTQIELKASTLSEKQLEKYNQDIKSMNGLVANSRDFILTKDAYRKLLDARYIYYTLETKEETIKGEFPQRALMDMKANSALLLAEKCYKGQTIEESKEELKQGFTDFEVLKKGATKTELENHFKTHFKNTVKDPETGAFEETIILKVFGQPLGPMIIGFDDQGNLVYTRDAFNKTKITYLKDK